MKRLKAILAVVLIFLFGAIFGAMNGAKWMERQFRQKAAEGPPAVSAMITRRLARQLDLRADQGDQVLAITREAQRKIAALREEREPAVRQIVREAETSIRALLEGSQAREFEALLEKAAASADQSAQ